MFNRVTGCSARLAVLTALSLGATIANAQDRPTIAGFIRDLGPRFTSNAFLSENDARSDVFIAPATGLEVSGKIVPGLEYSLIAAVVNTRYRRFSQLDDDTAVLIAGVAYTRGAWTFEAEYSPKWVYTREFDALSAELHDFAGALRGNFSWNGIGVAPALTARRRFSDLDLAENTRFGAGVRFTWNTSANSALKVTPGVTYTIYDASPVAGTDRKDLWKGVGVDYVYKFSPSVVLVLSTGIEFNNSTADGRSWKSIGASPSLNLSTKF